MGGYPRALFWAVEEMGLVPRGSLAQVTLCSLLPSSCLYWRPRALHKKLPQPPAGALVLAHFSFAFPGFLLLVAPQKTRKSPLGSAAARAQSLPASGCHLGLAAAPPPPRALVGKGLRPGLGSGGAGSGSGGQRSSGRCVCERESW